MVFIVYKKAMDLCCGDNEMMSKLVGKWFKKDHGKDEEQIPDTTKPNAQSHNNNHNNAGKIAKTFTMNDMHYETTVWSKLPLKARKAAQAIGYDQTKWDNGEWTEVSDKPWHDLSEDQIKHLETLGWTHDAWEHQYEHTDWKDLPAKVQKAASKAGFDEEKWDHDHWPDNLEHKHWDELAEKDRECMAVLGYTKHDWD